MSFLRRFLRIASTSTPASRPPAQLASGYSQQPRGAAPSTNSARGDLLRVVLRDTLNRHGIPASWISAELLISTSRTGERGVHWRLLVKHWEPRLLTHGVALQQSLIRRVMTFDPLASKWLNGISWQFALPDESVCPPMPHPGLWTAPPPPPPEAPRTAPIETAAAGSAKRDLEHLFAERDADFKASASEPGHDATQPMFLGTEPSPLR